MKDEPLLPGRQGLALDQRRERRGGLGVPDDEALLLREPGAVEEGPPIEPRSLGAEVGPLPRVVGLEHVGRHLAAGVALGHLRLEGEHPRGFRLLIGDARQVEHERDVLLVRGAELLHAR